MKQFYQLTLEDVIDLYKAGKITTSCAFELYIKVKFAPGWKIVIDRNEIMETFGISIHAFRRAIASLKDEMTIFVKSVKQVATAAVKKIAPSVNNVTPAAKKVAPSANSNPENISKINASVDSPDIRSNKDQISLSDKRSLDEKLTKLPEGEREKFLDFAKKQASLLPKHPVLVKAWISSQFDELCDRFKESSCDVVQDNNSSAQFVEWYDLMRQLGHATGERTEGEIRMVKDSGGQWIPYEKIARIWKLDYLRKCVRGN